MFGSGRCAAGVSVGDMAGDGDGDSDGGRECRDLFSGVGFGVGFWWCLTGVGDGPAKKRLILSPNVSSSVTPRANPFAAIANVTIATSKPRNSLFTTTIPGSRSQFLQYSLIHSDAGVEILQRKIFIGRVRAAIRQGQPQQQRLHAKNVSKI